MIYDMASHQATFITSHKYCFSNQPINSHYNNSLIHLFDINKTYIQEATSDDDESIFHSFLITPCHLLLISKETRVQIFIISHHCL